MKHKISGFRFAVSFALLCFVSVPVLAEEVPTVDLQQVIVRIIAQYPSVKIAQAEVEKSRQEVARVQSRLGWVLNTSAGVSRDVGAFDIPSQRFEANANLSKTIESGSQIEITGNYSYEDSDSVAIPVIVNPSERTRLDLNYRIPLKQGEGNPNYHLGLDSAQAGYERTLADKTAQIDALVKQTANLFYDAATTHARIKDADEAIKRSLRLVRYVKKNLTLGLVDKKDLLDVRALYLSKVAERDNLLVIWSRQRIELNGLMGRRATEEFVPEIRVDNKPLARAELLQTIFKGSPDLALQEARLKQTETEIQLARDAKKDKLDLVFSVGARNTSGDSATGSVDNSEWAGGARLEYRYSFDQRGFDSELYKQILQKKAIEGEIARIRIELSYRLDGILEQIDKIGTSLKSLDNRLRIEQAKVAEAFERYKTGRSNTNELIDNENALFASTLLYKTQKIELSRMYSELALLSGRLWNTETINQRLEVTE